MISPSSNQAYAEEILACLKKRKVRYHGDAVSVSVETNGWIEVTFLTMQHSRPMQKRIRINVIPVTERDNFDAVVTAQAPEVIVSEIERAIADIKVRKMLAPQSPALKAITA